MSFAAEELFQEETLNLISELEADSTSADLVKTISRLRNAGHPPERIHHAIEQVRLRRKARTKFAEFSSHMLFTEAGLEQATRLSVAAHHAGRFSALGVKSIADLGCGIGADSMAFASLGLTVFAVESDPLTAAIASYNLAPFDNAKVTCADATNVDVRESEALWLDPARREGGYRLHDPEDYSPGLDFAIEIARSRPSGIKLAPGMDRDLIPGDAEAQWVSVGGDVVEMVLWFGAARQDGITRSALVITGSVAHKMDAAADSPDADVVDLGEYLYEPDGAVIRARLIGDLARTLGGGMIDPTIAYISASSYQPTPFAQCFAVEGVMPATIKEISKWVARQNIGTVEIKKRGVDVDPAELRKKLPLSGENSRTLFLTRINGKKKAIATRRMDTRS